MLSVDKIDLWAGGLSESHMPGAMIAIARRSNQEHQHG